jgi:hypothetical protein
VAGQHEVQLGAAARRVLGAIKAASGVDDKGRDEELLRTLRNQAVLAIKQAR